MAITTSFTLARFNWSVAAITCIEIFETGLIMFASGQIMAGVGLSPEDFAMSYTLYGVASIFMLYKHKWFVERLGYRNFVLLSLLFFAVGSIICAISKDILLFVVGRILVGVGGATFFTAGRIMINDLPVEHRFNAIIWFVLSFLGFITIAPILAAILLRFFDYSAIFWICIPLCLIIAVIAYPCLNNTITPEKQRSQDTWGWLIWFVLALCGVQYTIHEIPAEINSPHGQTFFIAIASIICLILFTLDEWKKELPVIDYKSLFHARYIFGLLLYFFGYFISGALAFLLPILFKEALGLSLLTTSLVLSLSFFMTLIGALAHIYLTKRGFKQRPFLFIGVILFFAGCIMFSQTPKLYNWEWLLIAVFCSGLGCAIYMGPVAFGTFTEVKENAFSHSYQVKNIVRQLGFSTSIAMATAVLQIVYLQQSKVATDIFYPPWKEVIIGLTRSGEALGSLPLLEACSYVFLVLAISTIPLFLLLIKQKIFR